MPRFFTPDAVPDSDFVILGQDASHITRSLRMRVGDLLTVCDGAGMDYECRIQSALPDAVTLCALKTEKNAAEPSVSITLYAGFPKADKAEWIVQKAVELGVREIVFFNPQRSVSRPDDFQKRLARFERIAREAAMQSGRGVIPRVDGLINVDEMLRRAGAADCPLFFYECGGEGLHRIITPAHTSFALITGPEGGFTPDEAERARAAGIFVATLGARILRCETAPLCAVSAILYATHNL